MAENMNYILVKTLVKKAIHVLKTDPERTVRNLVDMALQFSDSRFQQQFFSTAGKLLSDEHSGYYSLAKDTLTRIDEEALLTVSMNLGYNGLFCGSKYIRQHEVEDCYNIPWTVTLTVSGGQNPERNHEIIRQGQRFGIHTWQLFSDHCFGECLSLAAAYPNSAFICFCSSGEIDRTILEQATDAKNIMILVAYDADADVTCSVLREGGSAFGLYYPYGTEDIPAIESGALIRDMEQLYPAVCVLYPKMPCKSEYTERVYRWVKSARLEQTFRTIVWELYADALLVDEVISEDPCWVGFDAQGQLYNHKGSCENPNWNIYRQDLPEILRQAYPRKQ